MRPRQIAVFLLTKREKGEKFVSDQHYRIVLLAAITFAFNLLYALYHCLLGIVNLSLWFIAMAAFYGILAAMRFSAVLCGQKDLSLSSEDRERFVMKLSGLLLAALSIVFAAISYISLSQNIATKHGQIVMITIATYTFYKISIAIIQAVKQHKNPSPLLRTLRSIR